MDAVGHVTRTEISTDPYQPDYVDTVYDGMGLPWTVSNPYRTPSDPTYGLTTYTYDSLGRQTSLAHPAGTGTVTTSYSSNVTISTDEVGNQWQRTYDSFGRLNKVLEPNGSSQSPSMETDYGYNALNALTSVTQWGGSSGSSGARIRSFFYDSLSRLIASSNPESASSTVPPSLTCAGAPGSAWTTCYGYDANGNLTSKTDNRSITSSYGYDSLDRLLTKSYGTSGTPSSCYLYDTASNGIGRLGSEWTISTTQGTCTSATGFVAKRSILGYDPMGRLLSEQQSTLASQLSGQVYRPAYTYDLAGNLFTSTDGSTPSPTTGSALSFTTTYDGAEHLASVTSNWADATHPSPLFFVQAIPPTPALRKFNHSSIHRIWRLGERHVRQRVDIESCIRCEDTANMRERCGLKCGGDEWNRNGDHHWNGAD